jgi:hypothetical protein
MGSLRFYRRVRIFPGPSVNLSKPGPSLSFGVRGAHVTVGRSGVRKAVGIPGTGIYYTSFAGRHSGFHSAHQETPLGPAEQAAEDCRAERVMTFIVVLAIVLIVLALAGRR